MGAFDHLIPEEKKSGQASSVSGVFDHLIPQQPAAQPDRPWMDRAKDFTEVAADSMSFGMLPRLAAKVKEMRGAGTYDENLAANRKAVDEASQRLGTAGSIGANLTGGVLTGTMLGRGGVTVLGHVPADAGKFAKIAAGTIEGGLYGAANEAGHSNATDWKGVAKDAAGGATTGMLVGAPVTAASMALPRLITPFINSDPERARLVQVLMDNKVPVTASQKTGSETLNMLENAAGKAPLGFYPKGMRDQGGNVAAAAAEKAGIPGAPQLTPHVIDDAFERVGGGIGALQAKYPPQYDNAFVKSLVDIADSAKVLGKDHQAQVNAFINRLLQPGATMTPEAMQALRTDLRLAVEKGPGGKPLFNRAVSNLRDALDDMLERTIVRSGAADDAAALSELRQQYANLNVLTDALNRSGAKGELGKLTPQALSGAVKSSIGKTDFRRGRGDLNDLGRASAAILPMKEGSGTAERNMAYDLIGAPLTAFVGPAMSTAINSPLMQRYLGNQLLPVQSKGSPALIEGLLSAGQNRNRRPFE